MLQTDVAIVGSGLAGSTSAAMLGRADIDALLIDPHETYPQDLRCEKLDSTQVAVLAKTGLADAVLSKATLDGEVAVARFGRLVETRPSDQHGILYDTLVNTIRDEIPPGTRRFVAKVSSAATSADRQTLTLSNGEIVSARLIVLAHGLNIGFAHGLGITREVLSPCHSITIGFDVKPLGRDAFDFPALTYWPESPTARMAYLSLFPIGSTMRANLMVYRDMRDPWLQRMRATPEMALIELMPGLGAILGPFEVAGFVKIRPADLYRTHGTEQDGVVLVGDAFASSCPAAGTGTTKVFTDVERLCNVHIPGWLLTGGMSAGKIDGFYNDPVKQASDKHSHDKAYWLRSFSTESGLAWRTRRSARLFVGLGRDLARRTRRRRSQGRSEEAVSAWS